MEKLVPYFKEELDYNKVNCINKDALKSDLITSYDGVILATGSKPAIPSIPGLKKFYWADILLGKNLPQNKKVLIIGGGLIGVDIATALIPKNNRIIIVKRTSDFGEDMEMIAKNLSLKIMKENGAIFSAYTHITKIDGRIVHAEQSGNKITFDDIDIIVVSTSMKSYNPLQRELEGHIPVYVIGDAKRVGNAQDAIRDAYATAKSL
jgi:pyruvate/2-oxoglutarate dehydrogenase complex dihydrolipoamide dehydrogenase (E3) component